VYLKKSVKTNVAGDIFAVLPRFATLISVGNRWGQGPNGAYHGSRMGRSAF
jgi:hypothetical protein